MYQILFERSPLPMWVYLTDSLKIRDVNEAAVMHYGYSKEEFLRLTIRDLRPPKYIPLIEAQVEKLMPYKKLFSRGIYQHRKKNGDVIDVQVRSSVVYIEDRKAELVVVTDITEIRAAEKEKVVVDERLREAQRIAKLGYWSRKPGESAPAWSREVYEIYDQNPEDFMPTEENLLSLAYEPDKELLLENLALELKYNESHDFKYRIVTKQGEVRWIRQRMELQKDISGDDIIMGITQDITERKKAGEKFKAIFDNTNDAIIIGDDDGNCLDYNPAAVVLFGRAHQELENMKLNELLKHPDQTRFTNMWDRFLTGEERTGTIDLLKKDGSIVTVNYNAKPGILPDIHVCIFTDITEQVLKQKQLFTSERRFKALVQEGADLIGILDIDGNYRFVAESSVSILGVHPDKFINKSVFEFIHPEDRSLVSNLFNKLLKNMQIRIPPFRFLDGSGHYRWIETICTNLLNDPSVGGIVTNSRDITDEVQKSNELKQSNERYKIIMKAANEAVYDWNIENDKVEWGAGFHEVFGYDLSVYNNNLWTNNIHVEDKSRVMRHLQEAVLDSSSDLILGECRYHQANGQIVLVEYRVIFLRNEDGVAIRGIGSVRDITDYKRNLVTVELQNEKLREIAWAQSHLARAPLARMMGVIDLLKNFEISDSERDTLLDYLLISANEFDLIIREIAKKTNQIKEG